MAELLQLLLDGGAMCTFVYVVATTHALVSVFFKVFLTFHCYAWIPVRVAIEVEHKFVLRS